MRTLTPWSEIEIGNLPLAQSFSCVEINGKQISVNWLRQDDRWTAELPGVKLECFIEKSPLKIRIHCKASLEKPIELFRFDLLCLPAMETEHYLGCGAKMGKAQLIKFPVTEEIAINSCHCCVITVNKTNTVISTPLNQKYENCFTAHAVGHLLSQLKVTFEVRHSDDTELLFDPVTIEYGNGFEILREYGKNSIEEKRDLSAAPAYGWNSWDYYRWTISEDEVIKNVEFLAKDPVFKKYIKRIIIDDGWQYCYGEWTPNGLFPSGMKKLAERITALGFSPGLWFAPSIIEPHCRIAQWDYDMLAMSEGGQPCLCFQCMKRGGFVLDPTVKKTQDFLRSLFDSYASMGYQYFKLDFLSFTMFAERFHDRTVSRSQIMRKLLSPIVEGINKRAEILGCNYPFNTGNIYANSVRTGGDIHAKWANICQNAPQIITMFWANKVLWYNDPDFAVCRGPETSDDPDLARLKPCLPFVSPASPYTPLYSESFTDMSRKEAEVLLSLDVMAAGAINLSDNMTKLNAVGLDMLRKVVSAEPGETATAVDLFESSLPSYFLQKISSGHRLLLVNWQDSPEILPVNWQSIIPKPAQVRDFWTGKIEVPTDHVPLEPHSCKLWEF